MKFEEASEAVKSLSKRPSNDVLLQLYSLYKQGTDGDVTGKRPGMLDVKGRAKYDAWKKIEGMAEADAQSKYISLVEDLIAND